MDVEGDLAALQCAAAAPKEKHPACHAIDVSLARVPVIMNAPAVIRASRVHAVLISVILSTSAPRDSFAFSTPDLS
jgi:hypothetical protein